ncbi:RNA polymerase I-specific transcription initiation factor RRN3 [Episyrphus balteatus]|uniref:RNA polymerase I-specific transcription initiation factor RRN3 n=1 Tax=Episyrphus balteatus TaxID=286459 RepID=UPI00248587F2|nr:RNA polymerase I-specific transcription initiation factor RRN3 [Episyrphus balteatus]
MSVYSAKTGLSSILKSYAPTEREKTKAAIINKVRFRDVRSLKDAMTSMREQNNFMLLNEYAVYLKESTLNEADFIRVISEAHSMVHLLTPKFATIAENLLSLPWTNRSSEAIQKYQDFFVDLLVAQIKYVQFAISKLIVLWIPTDNDTARWPNGTPTEEKKAELQAVHKLLARILSIIPITFDVILEYVEFSFPYYKKPAHVVAGYIHNVLWLMEYQPALTEHLIQVLVQKLLILDVNAPRSEIEEAEFEEENEDDMDDDEDNDEEMFKMEDATITTTTTPQETREILPMTHPIAHTLDMCMEKMYAFFDQFNPKKELIANEGDKIPKTLSHALEFLKCLEEAFNNVILPSHNTHHVQFLVFYFCSFKNILGEKFLEFLWNKMKDPNESAIIRQASVGYIASFLARSKTLPLEVLKNYLKDLCEWAHQYIQRCDQYRANGTLKANLVFFSVCQAIFYVIAFRSRDLTADKKGLLFLQSLQLSALVTCNFNPLRVCLPAVATAFAGVTRAYQLAYCHAILERNARRKLATVYANEKSTPEEALDTFFPFDPYLLKMSGKRIQPNYLQYQPNECEDDSCSAVTNVSAAATDRLRKRGDSEMADDIDDFLIADKRQKLSELARSHEAQFTYGLSPGFHT